MAAWKTVRGAAAAAFVAAQVLDSSFYYGTAPYYLSFSPAAAFRHPNEPTIFTTAAVEARVRLGRRRLRRRLLRTSGRPRPGSSSPPPGESLLRTDHRSGTGDRSSRFPAALLAETETAAEASCARGGGGGNRGDRVISSLQRWASERGVLTENGFALVPSPDGSTDGDDWSVRLEGCGDDGDDIAATTTATTNGTTKEAQPFPPRRVLQVPRSLILSSSRIRREELTTEQSIALRPVLDYLRKSNCQLQIPQFYLFLKVLREWEKGEQSEWYPWMRSLPRTFSTAVSMDEVELECLPPFAWSLARLERIHYDAFCQALLLLEDKDKDDGDDCYGPILLRRDTRTNKRLLRWAFNVVFTRCWGRQRDGGGGEREDDDRCDLVPVADMFNHGEPANVVVCYDGDDDGNADQENCNILMKHDSIERGTPLTLSYGMPTNPSRFLTVFGFVDENQPRLFCQIVVEEPSDRHVRMGYDTAKMTFGTKDGRIAEEVWDVLLYTILDQLPAVQNSFYEAHTRNLTDAKRLLRERYYLETCIVLKRHVDRTVRELDVLLEKIDALYAAGKHAEHDRLSLIRRYNAFVHGTFVKVKANVDGRIQAEVTRRKS